MGDQSNGTPQRQKDGMTISVMPSFAVRSFLRYSGSAMGSGSGVGVGGGVGVASSCA